MNFYRLRNLPAWADRPLALEMVVSSPIGVSPHQVRITSVALAIDPWTRPPTKTATLTMAGFNPCHVAHLSSGTGEWTFYTPGLAEPLYLDCHFHGLTPLNDVDPELHECDCIAISGPTGHPIGSWQSHAGDKSFMWIRDALPQMLPTVRFAMFGYETTLHPTTPAEAVPDLAHSLISVLKRCGWSSPSAKPLVFLAHSLGGVVLKQALVMLARGGQTETFISTLMRGIIFFGVPTQVMPIHSVFTMLDGQPSRGSLVARLSDNSHYLRALERQFDGISLLRAVKLFWAYETKETQTMAMSDGFTTSAPSTVLVTKESATGGRTNESLNTIQIDETHSDMVRFSPGDHQIQVFASMLGEICASQTQPVLVSPRPSNAGGLHVLPGLSTQPNAHAASPLPQTAPVWDDARIMDSLRLPELAAHIEQIVPHADHTFDWAFDKPSIGLSQWLHDGRGIFWISGKPGSGKSSLVRFLDRDPRTKQLMHQQAKARFFFHHRGTPLQKSFEGLLRRIVSQVVAAEPRLSPILRSVLDDQYNREAQQAGLGTLHQHLHHLASNAGCLASDGIDREIDDIIRDQNSLVSLRETLAPFVNPANLKAFQRVENELTRYRDCCLKDGDRLRKEQLLRRACWVGPELANLSETCVSLWLGKLDLNGRIRSTLQKYGAPVLEQNELLSVGGGEPRVRFSEDTESQIEAFLKAQMQREKLRIQVQDGGWQRERLEQVLVQICLQDDVKLDICLFLDALDEYDAPPEFVSRFFKNLTEGRFPKTKIRVLFSSRPWTHFRDEFAGYPGFRIHEHTQDDIRNYCFTTIPGEIKAVCNFPHLVEDIVARSMGVFPWVRLVVSDLHRVAAEYFLTGTDINQKLLETPGALPGQLEEYYVSIMERVPFVLRWKCYVVLETLARSDFNLSANDLSRIVSVSESRIPSYYRPNWGIRSTPEELRDAEQLVWGVSGGLVDIIAGSSPRAGARPDIKKIRKVQLMHKTVKDFVMDPRFRYLVLGRSRAEVREENGHSFIARYLLFPDNLQESKSDESRLYTHLRRAEETTGVSQYEFLKGLDHNHLIGLGVSSLPSLAARSGLRLLIKDVHQKDALCMANCQDRLLSDLVSGTGIPFDLSAGEAAKTAESFLSRGFAVEQDVEGLTELMRLIYVENIPNVAGTAGMALKPSRPDPYYVQLSTVVARFVKDPNINLRWAPLAGQLPGLLHTHGFDGSMIHLATPEIAAVLLERGANPNAMMKSPIQGSPIDYIISSESLHPSSSTHLHHLVLLLLQHGGKPQVTTPDEWDTFLTHLARDGFDIESDLWYPFPLQ